MTGGGVGGGGGAEGGWGLLGGGGGSWVLRSGVGCGAKAVVRWESQLWEGAVQGGGGGGGDVGGGGGGNIWGAEVGMLEVAGAEAGLVVEGVSWRWAVRRVELVREVGGAAVGAERVVEREALGGDGEAGGG